MDAFRTPPTDPSDNQGIIHVLVDGHEVFHLKALSTYMPFMNLEPYRQDHWLLEIVMNTKDIFLDGNSLNDIRGYQQSFSLLMVSGRPLYFFEKDHRIGISYDGEDTLLDYTSVVYAPCCMTSTLNPKSYGNIITFYAAENVSRYWVVLKILGQ